MASDGTGICTQKRTVAECSSAAQDCYSFQRKYKELFDALFADAYAHVCVEPSGVQCLSTNVAYKRCSKDDGKAVHKYKRDSVSILHARNT